MGRYSRKSNEDLTRIGVRSVEKARFYRDGAKEIVEFLERELARDEIKIDPKIIREIKTYDLASKRFDDFLYN